MPPDRGDFSLAFSRTLGRVVVHVYGPVHADGARELKARLVDLIDGQGNRSVVVDLSDTTVVGAAGLAVFVDVMKRMRRRGGELVFSGPSETVTRRFAAAGLDRVLDVTPAWAHPARGALYSRWGDAAGPDQTRCS